MRHCNLCVVFISVSQAKQQLCDAIDHYLRERITLADKLISDACKAVIKNGDVILVYAQSVP